MINTVNSLFPI